MKASLIVRSASGELIEVGPAVPVDRETVLAESMRLRRHFGTRVNIDASQIVEARHAMRRESLLTA